MTHRAFCEWKVGLFKAKMTGIYMPLSQTCLKLTILLPPCINVKALHVHLYVSNKQSLCLFYKEVCQVWEDNPDDTTVVIFLRLQLYN